MEPILQLADLTQTYPYGRRERTVLKGVNQDFEAGRMYAIVGPSGSGKTTLLSLASGLDSPTKGTVHYKGSDVAAMGLGTYRRRHVATVFQSLNLLGYMTAVQNVTAAMEITGVRGGGKRKRAVELLHRLGLEDGDIHRRTTRLSGGQQQRVAIARALACDVEILFADEPTGSLDQDTSAEIVDVFKELAHEDGKCVIVVTHSNEVSGAADEVLRLRKGKVMGGN